MFKNWGLTELDNYEYKESTDEMKHADRLIERTLFLKGLPNLQDLGFLRVGENTVEMVKADLSFEHDAISVVHEAIAYCEYVSAFVTRELFESILDEEEDHVDWLETQLDLIDRVGLATIP